MVIPARTSAAAMLLSLDPPHWHLRHSRAVAEIAGWLATRALERRLVVDRGLVEVAALLHDVDKLLPGSDPAAALPHGAGAASWLSDGGWQELGPAVAGHPVTRLLEPDADAWLGKASLEELIVAYADKRAGQRLEPMERRFAAWSRRYSDGWDTTAAATARSRADRLERDLCARLDIEPPQVGRRRWTGPALRCAVLVGRDAS